MLKHLKLLVAGAAMALALPAMAEAKTFYWISHGGPADPVWTYFLQGAEMWAKSTGQTVNTSFHNGDVPSQQEAIRAAIAAKADAIVTTSPDPGSLVEIVKEAKAAKDRKETGGFGFGPPGGGMFGVHVGGHSPLLNPYWDIGISVYFDVPRRRRAQGRVAHLSR